MIWGDYEPEQDGVISYWCFRGGLDGAIIGHADVQSGDWTIASLIPCMLQAGSELIQIHVRSWGFSQKQNDGMRRSTVALSNSSEMRIIQVLFPSGLRTNTPNSPSPTPNLSPIERYIAKGRMEAGLASEFPAGEFDRRSFTMSHSLGVYRKVATRHRCTPAASFPRDHAVSASRSRSY